MEGRRQKIHCKVFEDNTGALEIAKIHKYWPKTKYLNCRLYHCRSDVTSKLISIHKIDTKEQPADMLTKPLNEKRITKFRKMVTGW